MKKRKAGRQWDVVNQTQVTCRRPRRKKLERKLGQNLETHYALLIVSPFFSFRYCKRLLLCTFPKISSFWSGLPFFAHSLPDFMMRERKEKSLLSVSLSFFLFFSFFSPSLQERSKVQVGEKGHSSSSSLFFRGASSIPFFSFFLSEKCIHPSLSIFFSYTALSSRRKKGKGNFFSSSFSFSLNSAKIFWSGLISA